MASTASTHKFRVGDRVTTQWGAGTVIVKDQNAYLIEHDAPQEVFHSGSNRGKNNHCWWVGGRELEKLSGVDTSHVGATLDERAKTYGAFTNLASIAQRIKTAIFDSVEPRKPLAPDQREALEMIASKIARIINGDPDCVDSWHDIAGYAQLVADRLRGVVR